MPFPISTRGSVKAETPSIEQARSALEAVLREAGSSTVSADDAQIRFTVSLLRPLGRHNVLNAISSGTFCLAKREGSVEVRYHIWLLHTMVPITAVFLVVGLLYHSVIGIGILWMFFIVFVYAVRSQYFPAAFQKALNAALRRQASNQAMEPTADRPNA